ncbi:MAG: 23S rRNA (uracil(1939)-C(5))-methyltransferase RlmD [Candidatus Zixiibacteriota bacterium]
MGKTIRKGDILEVKVEKMVPEGLGLGRSEDGIIVFVNGAYPGEKAKVEVYKKKKSYLEAKTLEIIGEKHPKRKEPECPHFGICGGCRFLDIEYQTRLDFKEELIKDALERIGEIDLSTVDFETIVPSPRKFRHRNKMEFAFGTGDKGNVILGLRKPGDFASVIKADDCLLLPELSNDFMRGLLEEIAQTGLTAYDAHTKSGDLRYLTLRFNTKDEFLAYITINDRDSKMIFEPIFQNLSAKFSTMKGAGVFINEGSGGTATGDMETLYGIDYLEQDAGDVTFRVSPVSFFQTNIYATPLLVKQVDRFTNPGKTLWDLFSGIGTLSLPLAHKFELIYGIEIVEEAVEDAMANAKRNGIKDVMYIANTLRKGLHQLREISNPDVLVFDPPRSGIGKKALRAIMREAPPEIVYVSCNPVSLSRDINYISDMYRLEKVRAVDMFPHTYHVETVTRLVLKETESDT